MLYHLLVPLSDGAGFFNLFRYISFRTAWGLVTSLAIAYWIFPWFIGRMKQQKMNQIIREDGPESHRLTKVGTPTMGGVPILLAVGLSTLLWARLDQPVVWMTLVLTMGYGLIGLYDDWRKVFYKSSDGLSGRYKLLGQFGLAGIVLGGGWVMGWIEPDLHFPFFKHAVIHFDELVSADGALAGLSFDTVPLHLLPVGLWLIFVTTTMAGFSNAVNLTDGLDGLAIGPVMTSAGTFIILAYVSGNVIMADYLSIPYIEGSGELTVFCATLIGAGLGFLWYNTYPASIFMGDVGSLALGGALGSVAVITKHELLLVMVGGIFVLEALSVIIQVVSFKTTGKRVFKMAPIHHHYEKLGWSEPKIIVRFWIISVLLALVALSTLKVR